MSMSANVKKGQKFISQKRHHFHGVVDWFTNFILIIGCKNEKVMSVSLNISDVIAHVKNIVDSIRCTVW